MENRIESFPPIAEADARRGLRVGDVLITVRRTEQCTAAGFDLNLLQPLERVVGVAQGVARRGDHGFQGAVATRAVVVGVALGIALAAQHPALPL